MSRVVQILNGYHKSIDHELEPGHWGEYAKERADVISALREEGVTLMPNALRAQSPQCNTQFKTVTI